MQRVRPVFLGSHNPPPEPPGGVARIGKIRKGPILNAETARRRSCCPIRSAGGRETAAQGGRPQPVLLAAEGQAGRGSGYPMGIMLMARLTVTRIVTREIEDCRVNSIFTLCVSGIVSVGLKAMMFVYAV